MQEEWFKAQQQYWRAWQALLGAPAPLAALGTPGWAQPLGDWWRLPGDAKRPQANLGAAYRLLEQGRSYLSFAESLRRFADMLAAKPEAGADVTRALTSMLEDMQKAIPAAIRLGGSGVPEFLALLSGPIETWRNALGDTASLAAAAAPFDPTRFGETLRPAWGVPAVGISREWATRLQQLQQSLLRQQEAYQAMLGEHGRIAELALRRFAEQFSDESSPQGDIGTLRALYDLWVDCGEAAYREIVMTERYAKTYGDFANAVMQTRKRAQELRDDMLGAADIPNRRELATIIARQNALQKTVETIAGRIDATAGANLRRHVEVLTDEVNALREDVAALASKRSSRPRAAAAPGADARRKKPPPRRRRARGRAGEFDIDELGPGGA